MGNKQSGSNSSNNSNSNQSQQQNNSLYYKGFSPVVCKWGKGCRSYKNGQCRYQHPWEENQSYQQNQQSQQQQPNCVELNNSNNSNGEDNYFNSVECKWGRNCRSVMKGKCRYNHPWLSDDPNYKGQIYVMFHGTDSKNVESIKQNGFRQSQNEQQLMLGKGVYFTYHLEKAKNYGDYIFIVMVKVGKVKKIEYNGHQLQKTWHQNGYDSAYTPRGTAFSKKGYSEVCVYDPKNIKIISVHPKNEL